MNEIYAGYLSTAMRYAAPQVEKHGGNRDAFLGELMHSLKELGIKPEASGVKLVSEARGGEGHVEGATYSPSSTPTVASNGIQAGALLA